MRVFIFFILFALVFLFNPVRIYAVGSDECPVSAGGTDCQEHCKDSTGKTIPACTATCNQSVDPHVCAWSTGNSCTKWADNGSCIYTDPGPNWWINQICTDPAYPRDTQVIGCNGNTSGYPGGGSSCDSSKPPAKPVCYNPKDTNLVPPNHDLFIDDKIKFYWSFDNTKWNDCCTTPECKANRTFDIGVQADCTPTAPGAGINFDAYKGSAFWNRDIGWGSRSQTLRRPPNSPPGWLLSTNYCWRVNVTKGRGGGGENKSDWCYFTVNSTLPPPPPPPPPSGVAWWQGKDTDIIANGSIRSYVPSTYKFILDGLGTFPGVAIYGKTKSLTLPIIGAVLSSRNWKAQTDTNLSSSYSYASFRPKIPPTNSCTGDLTNISGVPDGQGYMWFKCTVDTNLTSSTGTANIGSKKIVMLVDGGNVNIRTKINLTKGVGFFGVFTTGNINIYKSVGGSATYDLEGIYFADGTVNTAYDIGADPTTSSLKFRGSVVSMGGGGVSLLRNLGAANATTPAEFFEYAPDQLFLLPSAFSTKKTQWQEVAP